MPVNLSSSVFSEQGRYQANCVLPDLLKEFVWVRHIFRTVEFFFDSAGNRDIFRTPLQPIFIRGIKLPFKAKENEYAMRVQAQPGNA
jgi:hypothetical protein